MSRVAVRAGFIFHVTHYRHLNHVGVMSHLLCLAVGVLRLWHALVSLAGQGKLGEDSAKALGRGLARVARRNRGR